MNYYIVFYNKNTFYIIIEKNIVPLDLQIVQKVKEKVKGLIDYKSKKILLEKENEKLSFNVPEKVISKLKEIKNNKLKSNLIEKLLSSIIVASIFITNLNANQININNNININKGQLQKIQKKLNNSDILNVLQIIIKNNKFLKSKDFQNLNDNNKKIILQKMFKVIKTLKIEKNDKVFEEISNNIKLKIFYDKDSTLTKAQKILINSILVEIISDKIEKNMYKFARITNNIDKNGKINEEFKKKYINYIKNKLNISIYPDNKNGNEYYLELGFDTENILAAGENGKISSGFCAYTDEKDEKLDVKVSLAGLENEKLIKELEEKNLLIDYINLYLGSVLQHELFHGLSNFEEDDKLLNEIYATYAQREDNINTKNIFLKMAKIASIINKYNVIDNKHRIAKNYSVLDRMEGFKIFLELEILKKKGYSEKEALKKLNLDKTDLEFKREEESLKYFEKSLGNMKLKELEKISEIFNKLYSKINNDTKWNENFEIISEVLNNPAVRILGVAPILNEYAGVEFSYSEEFLKKNLKYGMPVDEDFNINFKYIFSNFYKLLIQMNIMAGDILNNDDLSYLVKNYINYDIKLLKDYKNKHNFLERMFGNYDEIIKLLNKERESIYNNTYIIIKTLNNISKEMLTKKEKLEEKEKITKKTKLKI